MMTTNKQKLLVASTNRKKLKELQELIADLALELCCLADLPNYEEVAETGQTFEENATLKAIGYSQQSGLLTLAEDSGLCCDALDGAPGVLSARFAGLDKDDDANNNKLLKIMENLPDNCRGAHFVSAACIAYEGISIGVVEGKVFGSIYRSAEGKNGFGYDAVFFYPPYQKTFGQVSSELKYRVSHRAQALQKAKGLLQNYLMKNH